MKLCLGKVRAFARKEFTNDISYTVSFLSRWVGIGFSVVTYYYFSSIVGGRGAGHLAFYGGGYFSFILTGIALTSYLNSAINGFPSTVGREQGMGTLEVLLTTPTSLPVLIACFASYNLFMGALAGFSFLFLGSLLGCGVNHVNLFSGVIVLALSTVIFLSLGLISAGSGIIFRRGDPIRWILNMLLWLLGGLYFPVTVFPEVLQRISYSLPSTYILDAWRLAFLRGYPVSFLKIPLLILSLFAFGLFFPAYAFFRFAIRHAKTKGTVSFG